MYWPTASAPADWHAADGAAISRTTYAALFALIGTTYGAGDGSTTFNLPDMTGANRFPRASTAPGGTGGTATHTHIQDAHHHTINPPSTTTSPGSSQAVGTLSLLSTASPAGHTHDVDIPAFDSADTTATNQSSSNLPPYLDLLPIIRVL